MPNVQNQPRPAPWPHRKSRTFWAFFISYLALLTTLVVIMGVFSWYGVLQRIKRENSEKNLSDARALSSQLDDELLGFAINAQKIREVPWIRKLYTGSAVFESYFDTIRRREILWEVPLYAGGSASVIDSVLLFPNEDISISVRGWLSMDEYWCTLGLDGSQQQTLLSELRAVSSLQEIAETEPFLAANTLILAAPLESIAQPRAYICWLVRGQSLAENVQRTMPGSIASLEVLREDGSTVFQAGNPVEGNGYSCESSSLPGWRYHFTFSAAPGAVPADELLGLFKANILLLLAGLTLSYLLSVITYRPLGRVLARITPAGGQRTEVSDYHLIRSSFESLEEENRRMRDSVGQYEKTVRLDMIRQLLKGRFDEEAIQQDLDRWQIPFPADGLYQVMVLSGGEQMEAYPAVQLMDKLRGRLEKISGCRHELVESMDGDLIIVLAFPSGKEASRLSRLGAELARELIALCAPYFSRRPLVSAGGVHEGYVGISISYHFAVDQRFHLPRSWGAAPDDEGIFGYYYPLEWENQLIVSLKAGSQPSADRILTELRRENKRLKPEGGASQKAGVKLISMILETLLRVISELSLDDRLFIDDLDVVYTDESFDQKWLCLQAISARICLQAVSRRAEPENLGKKLAAYVDEHFCESSLCLKSLGDVFGLSVQSISRLFKAAAGDTFYNYLYRKRMEYACELLRTTNGTMANVANQVGYENEFSFKRAFVRYTGIRPKEYMENNRSS